MTLYSRVRITRQRTPAGPSSGPARRLRLHRVIPRVEELETRCVLAAGIQNIQHVIIIMQENRYFGTYPGAA